jgi:hypothetical protein
MITTRFGRAFCPAQAEQTWEKVLGDKQAAKLRRRDNREQRERDKAERTGDSPAQKAEQARRDDEAAAARAGKKQSPDRDTD